MTRRLRTVFAALVVTLVTSSPVGAETFAPRIVNGLPSFGDPTTGALLAGPSAGPGDGVLLGHADRLLDLRHRGALRLRRGRLRLPVRARRPRHERLGRLPPARRLLRRAVDRDPSRLRLSRKRRRGAPPRGARPRHLADPARERRAGARHRGHDRRVRAERRRRGRLRPEAARRGRYWPRAGATCPTASSAGTSSTRSARRASNSNTCNGDSGGPLFVDEGEVQTLAGITSGGDASDCLVVDHSYDTSVAAVRAYIEAQGGAGRRRARAAPPTRCRRSATPSPRSSASRSASTPARRSRSTRSTCRPTSPSCASR